METKYLTCIGCPMGCQLTVTFEPGNRDSVKVTGNTCQKGVLYAIDEVTNPTRTVTGTIALSNRAGIVVPVKTKGNVPKDKIFEVAEQLKKLSAEAPVRIGEIACANICGTGTDLVFTKNID